MKGCICNEKYIRETKISVEIRWMEHNTPRIKSNPAKHLRHNIDDSFTWKVICNAPNRKLTHEILEAYFIATMKPSLHDKINSDFLHLTFLETVLHNFNKCIYFQWDHYFNL